MRTADSLHPDTPVSAVPPARALRVLIACHSHPEVSNGGAETAAFQLYRRLREREDAEAWYLGCDRGIGAHRPGVMLSQPFSETEFLYAPGAFDWFHFANREPRFRAEIEALLLELRPDVVHFHHFINFGVEVFQHVKRVLPHCRIVLTLHEYLAICHHYGQMVTKDHYSLCHQATPAACHECFPARDRTDFFLRKLYIHRFLDLVDVFVSPSRFLAERYIAWGVPAARMTVIENLMPDTPPLEAATPAADGILRIGFFGQISTLKGIDVLFDAAAMLAARDGTGARVCFEIHGDYRGQPPEFQAAFLARLAAAGPNIRFRGPYDRTRVDRLMQSVHAVLVPSIWWENSPVVIQEALRNRRPVVCSDIGGMAEKIRPGIDGFYFAAGNPVALAATIERFVKDPGRLESVAGAMTGQPALVATIEDYLSVYRG